MSVDFGQMFADMVYKQTGFDMDLRVATEVAKKSSVRECADEVSIDPFNAFTVSNDDLKEVYEIFQDAGVEIADEHLAEIIGDGAVHNLKFHEPPFS